MNPQYPVYIVSKGRWQSRLTAKELERIKVPYHIVIEPQEYDLYASVIDKSKILTLPFSNLGQGSIPARNWIWEHSISIGAKRHWILDDNIRTFYILHKNNLYKTSNGVTFRIIEDWADRFSNLALAGMQYKMFTPRKQKRAYVTLNTRIYSCILINNEIPYRWRGRYNEDTDLSLRALKDGWVTALFNLFPADKIATMTMKGGNTESLYVLNNGYDGRYLMAKSLFEQHPDVVEIKWKWNRWQHSVDYSPFKNNAPVQVSNDFPVIDYGLRFTKNGKQVG